MTHLPKSSDRLKGAAALLLASVLLCAAATGVVVIDAVARDRLPDEKTVRIFHRLGLSNLAMVPSGRLFRHPETLQPGRGTGHTLYLPDEGIDPAGLLLVFPGRIERLP